MNIVAYSVIFVLILAISLAVLLVGATHRDTSTEAIMLGLGGLATVAVYATACFNPGFVPEWVVILIAIGGLVLMLAPAVQAVRLAIHR